MKRGKGTVSEQGRTAGLPRASPVGAPEARDETVRAVIAAALEHVHEADRVLRGVDAAPALSGNTGLEQARESLDEAAFQMRFARSALP